MTPPDRVARIFNDAVRLTGRSRGQHRRAPRALRVRGRKTGELRGVVVNLLTSTGASTWCHRGATPSGRAMRGRPARSRWGRVGGRAPRRIVEVADDAKPDLLKRYLDRWYWEVKGHIGGLTPDSRRDQMRAAAPSIPVFEVVG